MSRASDTLKKLGLIEAVDTGKVIQALIDFEPSSDNKDQGRFSQLIKGMSFSDDKDATEFVKRLMKMVDDKSFGDLT